MLIGAVHAVVDGNETNICSRQNNLGAETYLEVVSAQSVHVLYDDRIDFSFIYKIHKALPVRRVKSCIRAIIVHENMVFSELLSSASF